MARRAAWLWLLVSAVALSASCSRGPAPPPEGELAPEIVLQEIDAAGLAEAIARHRGNVILVDFWATWCPPCVELFPHAVEMHRRWADRGLRVLAVSMDDPDKRESVLRFLRAQGAAFECYINRDGLGSAAIEAFGIDDGALPHLKLFSRDGRLAKTFSGADPDELDRAVEALL